VLHLVVGIVATTAAWIGSPEKGMAGA
jgi:hypothetical protein